MEDDFQAKVLQMLSDIHTQTIKTNGRVTAIESWKTETEPKICGLEAWKNRIIGGIGIIIVLIVPMALEALKKVFR